MSWKPCSESAASAWLLKTSNIGSTSSAPAHLSLRSIVVIL